MTFLYNQFKNVQVQKMYLQRFFVAFLAFFIAFVYANRSPSAAQVPRFIIKFATVAPDGSIWMKQMRKIVRQIKEKSQGTVDFKLYPGGVAGGELEILKKIRIGQLQCAAFSGVGFGKILPEVRVLDLPFLCRSTAQVDRLLIKLTPYFRNRFKDKGFILLSWAEIGNVYVYSKRPIRKVHDFVKCKPWSWAGDPIAKEAFSVLGVTPITLHVTDVTTALSTGMVDTVYAPPLGLLALQWHPYVKYMNALPFAHSTGALLLSSKVWKKLPKNLRELVSNEFEKNSLVMAKEVRTQNQKAISVLKKHGIIIIPEPTGQALREFDSVRQRVASALSGKIYPRALLERVYQIMGRN